MRELNPSGSALKKPGAGGTKASVKTNTGAVSAQEKKAGYRQNSSGNAGRRGEGAESAVDKA